MSISVDGNEVSTNAAGLLENFEDWSEKVAQEIAADEQVELSGRHWHLISFLRDHPAPW